MTYCAAAIVEEGIVFASDSRTSAGIDQVSVYSKMNLFEAEGERILCLLSAGNLGTTQSVIALLHSRSRLPGGEPVPGGILALPSLYEVAVLVGQTLREVVSRDGPSLQADGIDASGTFILGGQIRGEPPRLFLVYQQGNFIEALRDTPYFQIGERKYGKPVLDRVLRYDTPLDDAAKCLVVSFDLTMRSNLSVGLPIDLLAYEKDTLRVTRRRRYSEGDPFFEQTSEAWSAGLLRVFSEVPDIRWQ
jgi:putative proteasome-type protease